ncbi:MAG: hypothetical protein MUF81_06685 [Verrucomicrobia bacterium]|jgi:hypothetical protein|nr:hypothetical protein [Verrucomicrobiota bacterium]
MTETEITLKEVALLLPGYSATPCERTARRFLNRFRHICPPIRYTGRLVRYSEALVHKALAAQRAAAVRAGQREINGRRKARR